MKSTRLTGIIIRIHPGKYKTTFWRSRIFGIACLRHRSSWRFRYLTNLPLYDPVVCPGLQRWSGVRGNS